MSLLIGIDMGQSSALAIAANEKGQIIGYQYGPPCNGLFAVNGDEQLIENMKTLIGRLENTCACCFEQVEAVGYSMTGRYKKMEQLSSRIVKSQYAVSVWDAEAAIVASSFERKGAVIIAGTGSVAMGYSKDKQQVRVGGWGYGFGDEGSGYDIGIQALRAAAKEVDCEKNHTLLLEEVLKRFDSKDMYFVKDLFMEGMLKREDIASLCKTVAKLALQGDLISRKILINAAENLIGMAELLIAREVMDKDIQLITAGGVFEIEIIFRLFREKMQLTFPELRITKSILPTCVGALLVAMESAGIRTNDQIIGHFKNWYADHRKYIK